jgi:hypothetical protein
LDTWENIVVLPQDNGEIIKSFTVDNKAYFISQIKIYIYDNLLGTWTTKSLPQSHSGGGVGLLGKKIYIVGGWIENNNYKKVVDVFNTETELFETPETISTGRCGINSCISTPDHLYIVGNTSRNISNEESRVIDVRSAYLLKGKNTFDATLNGCDSTDVNFSKLKIKISNINGGDSSIYAINNGGDFILPVNQGTYTIEPILDKPNFFDISPSSLETTFATIDSSIIQNFCVTPKGTHYDVEVTLLPTTVARPGFESKYQITLKNNGNQVESGDVYFKFNSEKMEYVSSNIVPDEQLTDSIRWHFSNFALFDKKSIILTMKTKTTVPIGTILELNTEVQSENLDETPLDNNFTIHQTLVGAYDPNDKVCLEGENIFQYQLGDYLHYLIRFENTGTYNASNVVIIDNIDTFKLEMSTLRLLETSHDCRV